MPCHQPILLVSFSSYLLSDLCMYAVHADTAYLLSRRLPACLRYAFLSVRRITSAQPASAFIHTTDVGADTHAVNFAPPRVFFFCKTSHVGNKSSATAHLGLAGWTAEPKAAHKVNIERLYYTGLYSYCNPSNGRGSATRMLGPTARDPFISDDRPKREGESGESESRPTSDSHLSHARHLDPLSSERNSMASSTSVSIPGKGQDGPRIFVTVGSTQFSDLIRAVLSSSVIDVLADACKPQSPTLTVQYGVTPMAEILTGPDSALLRAQSDKEMATGALGASGVLKAPMSAPTEQNEVDQEALKEEDMAKTFKLDQYSIHDHDSDTVQTKKLQQAEKSKHLTFHIPTASRTTVVVELIDFVCDLRPYLASSQVVISHAGSGTIIETLRLDASVKPTLVVVPNETLMSNHQNELALALAKQNYVVATRVSGQKTEK